MANIRDQCSWVHAEPAPRPPTKAKDLVRMAVARRGDARAAPPAARCRRDARGAGHRRRGGRHDGRAGPRPTMGSSRTSSSATARLGGRASDRPDAQGFAPGRLRRRGPQKVIDNLESRIHPEGRAVRTFRASSANFSGVIRERDGKRTTIDHGVVVVATAGTKKAEPFGLGSSDRIVTGLDLEQDAGRDDEKVTGAGAVASSCAGSLDENRGYCSPAPAAPVDQERIRLKQADPAPTGLRLVQGGPHLRLLGGVLHAGARARRHLRALRQFHQAGVEVSGPVKVT